MKFRSSFDIEVFVLRNSTRLDSRRDEVVYKNNCTVRIDSSTFFLRDPSPLKLKMKLIEALRGTRARSVRYLYFVLSSISYMLNYLSHICAEREKREKKEQIVNEIIIIGDACFHTNANRSRSSDEWLVKCSI